MRTYVHVYEADSVKSGTDGTANFTLVCIWEGLNMVGGT